MSSEGSAPADVKHNNVMCARQEGSAKEFAQSIEELLGQSNRFLIETLDNFQDGIFVLDKNWNFIYVNKRAADIAGFKPQDIVGKNLWEAFPQDKGTPLEENYRLAIQTQQIKHFETQSVSGKTWLEITVYPSKEGIIVHWHDITKRKQAEAALLEAKEQSEDERKRLATILETIPIAIVILEAPDGKVSYANRLAYLLYGVDTAAGLDLAGLDLETILTIVKPKKLDGTPYLLEDVPARRALNGQEVRNEEMVLERVDGTRFPILSSTAPISDAKGKITAAIVIFEDITERKQIQQKLQEYTTNLERLVEERTEQIRKSDQSYHELYESFDEAFIATDWEFNVIHWNKAAERITNVPVKEALGKKIYNVLPEMTTVNIEPYLEALQKRKNAKFTMSAKNRQTGKDAIFQISTYPSTLGIIIIVEDITVQETLRQLSTVGQTAGMVGHDIRNPLQAINGELFTTKQIITESLQGKAKQEALDGLNIIQEQVDYISKIVSDLQDYAKPLNPECKEVDLSELIKSTLFAIKIPDSIALSTDIENCPKIESDPVFVRRALTNLINNAIQAMPEGGKLTIAVSQKEKQTNIIVQDTGKGIPEEVKSKLFTPLFTTKSKGQGFGLAVTKRLIESLGGTISFESEEGKGTKFIVELPAK